MLESDPIAPGKSLGIRKVLEGHNNSIDRGVLEHDIPYKDRHEHQVKILVFYDPLPERFLVQRKRIGVIFPLLT